MTKTKDRYDAFFRHLEEVYDTPTATAFKEREPSTPRAGFVLNKLLHDSDDRTETGTEQEIAALRSVSLPVLGNEEQPIEHRVLNEGVETARLHRSQAAASANVYGMNASSALAALALQVKPEMEVLDLAAAPGGKTLLLASAMRNTGYIGAVEAVRGRFHRLRANLARCGVTNARCFLDDGRKTGRKVGERFDRVLLDAPCATEALIRWHDPATIAHWSGRKVKECARKQRGLIASAFAALKPGGELLYSTCSFSVEENEAVVSWLLEREPRAETMSFPPFQHLDEVRVAPNTVTGRVEGRGKPLQAGLANAVRVLPDAVYEGFFLAKIRKRADVSG